MIFGSALWWQNRYKLRRLQLTGANADLSTPWRHHSQPTTAVAVTTWENLLSRKDGYTIICAAMNEFHQLRHMKQLLKQPKALPYSKSQEGCDNHAPSHIPIQQTDFWLFCHSDIYHCGKIAVFFINLNPDNPILGLSQPRQRWYFPALRTGSALGSTCF